MKTLLILRHAKSSWQTPGSSDHDRPLNARGKHDAPRIGQLLRDEGLRPELILSSTAKRARKTAKKVVGGSGYDVRVDLLPVLYLSGTNTHIELLRQQLDAIQCLMIVAHNPGLEETLALLVGGHHRLPTAALAHVEIPVERWPELSVETRGILKNFWLPRELD